VTSTLVRKSWNDLWRRPARLLLTTLTIALAVASFGILAMPALMNRAMTAEVTNARLYNLTVPVDDVVLSAAQMKELAQVPNVVAVVGRSLFDTRALIGGQRVATEVWGVPNFAHQPLDRVITTARPGAGQVLVDAQDANLGIYRGRSGDRLRLQAADGSFRTFLVVGSARAMAFNQDAAKNRLVLYASQPTVQRLGALKGVNYLEFQLRNASPPAAHKTAVAVQRFLATQPVVTAFAGLPTVRAPGDWPLKQAFDQRSEVLDILTVLAVLSAAFLLANTVRTMIAEQTGEIGIMRAVGASRRHVRRTLLRTAAYLGLLGALIGVPLGIALAYVLVGMFAQLLFGAHPAFAVDWPVALASAVAGVGGAVLTAWLTLHKALRTPVREALSSEGLVSAFGGSTFDRATLRTAALPPLVRVGVRNVARQKERSATTIVQVALAVATFLGLASLGLAVSQVTSQSWSVLNYDITLATQTGAREYPVGVVDVVRAQHGVAGVEAVDEAQMTYRGQTLYALGVHARSFVDEPLAAGRWLTPGDVRAGAPVIIAGSAFARIAHLHIGSRVSVAAQTGPARFTVIGIGKSTANNGFNVYMPLGALQAATDHQGVTNTLLVRASDKSHAAVDALAAHLEGRLGQAGYPTSAQLIYSDRANGLAQSQTMLVIVQSIGLLIVVISMLGLVNAITMNVIERTREVGVLRCLGAGKRDIRRIFRTEIMTLALIGFLLSVPLGLLVAHALQWLVLHLTNLRLPVPYSLSSLAVALVGTVVLAVVATSLPLRRATGLRPGQAIRYNG
jgi:putative ABC transport system permease protein